MTNLLESLANLLGSLIDDEPKPPLHAGEVMALWTLLTIYQEGQLIYQIALNTTPDQELRHAAKNALENSIEASKLIRDFLIKEGVTLPKASEPKPDSSPESIPLGVKFTDEELANLIMGKISACIALCGQALAQCLRNDVGLLLLQSMGSLLKYGTPYKSLMKKRGWLIAPPFYYPPGATMD